MASSLNMDNAKTVLIVSCNNCGQQYALPREAAGQSKKCKVCENLVEVPWECFYPEGSKNEDTFPTQQNENSAKREHSRSAKSLWLLFEERHGHPPFPQRFSMPNTPGEVLRRRFRRLVTSPLVFLPTVLGVLQAWWCFNEVWNQWDDAAILLLASGVVFSLYFFTLGAKKHTASAREDLRRIGKRREGARLQQFNQSIAEAQDSRPTTCLDRLGTAFTRLQQVDRWRYDGKVKRSLEIAEIHDLACRLYLGCRNMLEQSQKLLNGADEMATDAAKLRVIKSREMLLGELQTSLQQLEQALDEVHSTQLFGQSQPIEDAAELREELRLRVEVVRQIEERMDRFTSR